MRHEGLQADLEAIAERAKPGVLGIAVRDLQTGAYASVNADRPLPMQSVFKAPLGAALLALVDAGQISLDERMTITEEDLAPPFSPIAGHWPERDTYTIRELLVAAVGESDNTAADVLMRRVGGPQEVTRFLRSHRIEDMRVDRYERTLQVQAVGLREFDSSLKEEAAWVAAMRATPEQERRAALEAYLTDPRDSTTAEAANLFLEKLQARALLSPWATKLLLDIMTATPTGARRLKAGLPEGAVIAHKTGTARPDFNVAPAVNDIGIVTLPDGRSFVISALLSASTLSDGGFEELEALLADAARAAVARLYGTE